MVTLSVTTVIVLLLVLTLGIMSIIGLFNKRVNGQVNLAVGFIRNLKVSWKNLERLPSRFRLLIKIWPHKRGLLLLKIRKKLKANRQERKKRRRQRRQLRKTRKQKNRSH